MVLHFTDIGRTPPTYGDAATVANNIVGLGINFDVGDLYYNIFNSVVSYKTTSMPLYTAEHVENAGKIHTYDSWDADVLQSYNEFQFASLLYYAMKENACSEQSARMTAMDAASKNAG